MVARLPYLASLTLADGGWRRGGLGGGQTVLVNRATGGTSSRADGDPDKRGYAIRSIHANSHLPHPPNGVTQ